MKLLLACLSLCLITSATPAADWPQWRGPDRTDISKEPILKTWPKDGPKLLWKFTDAGNGYSGYSVVGDKLYTMGTKAGKEVVFCLNTADGKVVWTAEVGNIFNNRWGDGPRGTPTVDGENIFALGGQGQLVCLTQGGKQVWSTNLRTDLGGRMMSGWGYTESPLVDGDRVICTPGGNRGTLAALDRKTGKVLWRSKDLTDDAAYSSVIVATVQGVRQYIQMTGSSVAGVQASDGKLLWRYAKQYRTAAIPTPIYHDGHVYATSGYGVGCDLIKLTKEGDAFKAEAVYSNKNMVNHHGGVVLYEGHIYGYSDRGWVCQNFKTGEVVWTSRSLEKGSCTLVDGKLLCYGERSGKLVVIEASPKGWKELASFRIPQESNIRSRSGGIWTHPVVANGKLYLRDQDLIFCYDVKGSNTPD